MRGQVEQFLRSDIFPEFSIVDAERECARMKLAAEEYCKQALYNANTNTRAMHAEAIKKADELATRQAANVKNTLRTAVRELNQLLDNLP